MIVSKENKLLGFALVIVLLLLWEGISRLKFVNPIFLPPFSEIIIALIKTTLSGELPKHIGYTIFRCFLGYFLATFVAVPIGIMMGRSKLVYSLFEPLVEMLRPIPSAAIIPVAILFLGIYTKMKLAVIIFGSLWPILINTFHGVRGIDPILVDTGRTFNLNKKQFLMKIIIPGASPSIATGMRISLAIALILAITVEMIAGSDGLGFYIIDWERSFHFKEMYAGIFALGILGYLINFLFLKVDSKVMRWYEGFTSAVT
jgi:ABC-type nitrate/sulfonate/bicarbonate transport system permease component